MPATEVIRFLGIGYILFLLVQLYVLRAYREWIRRTFEPHKTQRWLNGGTVLFITANILLLVQVVQRIFFFYPGAVFILLITYPAGIYFGAVMSAFLILIVRDTFNVSRWLIRHFIQIFFVSQKKDYLLEYDKGETLDEGRRKFLRGAGIGMLLVSTASPIVTSLLTARNIQIKRIPLFLPRLPRAFSGMTIVQFSDIHCGMFMSEGDIKDIVATVNSLNADIIVITGDFVDNSDSQIKPMVNALQGLKADVGVFGCLGNHDHFASAQKVTSALEKTPVRLLINANLPLTINNQTIWFIGVDDFGLYKRNFARLDRAIAGVPNEVFKILLSHRPDFWRFGKKADVDLTLAGHTHGGQIGVQIGDVQLNPIRFFHQYVSGLFEEEGKQLYVNVGVGMVGMPVRLVLPELSFFELHTA